MEFTIHEKNEITTSLTTSQIFKFLHDYFEVIKDQKKECNQAETDTIIDFILHIIENYTEILFIEFSKDQQIYTLYEYTFYRVLDLTQHFNKNHRLKRILFKLVNELKFKNKQVYFKFISNIINMYYITNDEHTVIGDFNYLQINLVNKRSVNRALIYLLYKIHYNDLELVYTNKLIIYKLLILLKGKKIIKLFILMLLNKIQIPINLTTGITTKILLACKNAKKQYLFKYMNILFDILINLNLLDTLNIVIAQIVSLLNLQKYHTFNRVEHAIISKLIGCKLRIDLNLLKKHLYFSNLPPSLYDHGDHVPDQLKTRVDITDVSSLLNFYECLTNVSMKIYVLKLLHINTISLDDRLLNTLCEYEYDSEESYLDVLTLLEISVAKNKRNDKFYTKYMDIIITNNIKLCNVEFSCFDISHESSFQYLITNYKNHSDAILRKCLERVTVKHIPLLLNCVEFKDIVCILPESLYDCNIIDFYVLINCIKTSNNNIEFHKYIESFVDSFNHVNTFKYQFRFVLILCKLVLYYMEIDVKGDRFIRYLNMIIQFSTIYSNILIPLISLCLYKIIQFLGLSVKSFYFTYTQSFTAPLFDHLHKNSDKFIIFNYLSNLSLLFFYNPVESAYIVSYIIIELICYSVLNRSSNLLFVISSVKNCQTHELIIYYAKYIFPQLFVKCTFDEIIATIKFIETHLSVKIKLLFNSELHPIIHHSCLYLYEYEKQILSAISSLITSEPFLKPVNYAQNSLNAFFYNKLLGILAFFNFTLSSNNLFYQKLVIQSLSPLIVHAGQQSIIKYRYKLFSILKYSTQLSISFSLTSFIIDAWYNFFGQLTTNYLNSIINQSILTIFQLITLDNNRQLCDIFTLLFVTYSNISNSYMNQLQIFTTHDNFIIFYQLIQKYWYQNILNNDINQVFNTFQQHLLYDYFGTRKYVIINLSDYIFHLYYETSTTIFENINKSIIYSIYQQLLQICIDSHSLHTFHASRCLALLGAIDSTYFNDILPIQQQQNAKIYQLPSQVNSELDQFIIHILNELSHAITIIVETHYQDCAAYAIQELLQLYKFSSNSHFFHSFKDHVQQILTPYLTSSYSTEFTVSNHLTRSDQVLVLYNQQNITNFNIWTRHYCAALITLLPHDTFYHQLFLPCYAIVRHHLPFAQIILPYVIIAHFLLDKYTQSIYHEFHYILNLSVTNNTDLNENHIITIETIFQLLDFLTKYQSTEKNVANQTQINTFFDMFSKKFLSHASFACRSYARALRYLEKYVEEQTNINEATIECSDLFKKIYYYMGDYDGIIGTSRALPSNHLDSSFVLTLELEGKFMEAIACYEKLITNNSNNNNIHSKILQCYLNLAQFQSVITYYHSLDNPSSSAISSQYSEALSKLSSWDELGTFINQSQLQPHLYTLFHDLCDDSNSLFQKHLVQAYTNEAQKLSFISTDTNILKQSSTQLSRLHAIFDIEMYYRTLHPDFNIFDLPENIHSTSQICQNHQNNFNFPLLPFQNWSKSIQARLKITEMSFDIREPILNTHRILYNMINPTDSPQHTWVDIARCARKYGYIQTAFNYLLFAQNQSSNSLSYIRELTKYLISTRSKHEALEYLKNTLPKINIVNSQDQILWSNLKLKLCQLMSDTSDSDPSDIIKSYNVLIDNGKNMEKVYFMVGNYFDKLIHSSKSDVKNINHWNIYQNIVYHYGSSLKYGYRYIHHSLPRLITIWLDFPQYVYPKINDENKILNKNIHQDSKDPVKEMCDKIKNFIKIVPPFVFLTVLPQLVSRICHTNNTIWEALSLLLIKLLTAFPNQVSWQMIGVAHSSFTQRVKRCKIIFDCSSKDNSNVSNIISNLNLLTCHLLEICNKKENKDHFLLSTAFTNFKNLLMQNKFNNIIIPFLSTLTCNIPTTLNLRQHQYFIDPMPYIVDIRDKVDVLTSLIKPKKIVIVASNGQQYSLLCKPKDDLRRDSRLMEFNSLVNKFLFKNTQARKRNLRIRLYAVIPINDECGVIEWVDSTVSYRSILLKFYNARKLGLKTDELRQTYTSNHRNVDGLVQAFTSKILPAYPPMLQNYFLQQYQHASSWYTARQLFTRSAAVMSIVGYILGLGDRHGDNILFVNTGEVVHVDFNCLFNKGQTFEWPEKVPFRLTHNMVTAMGPLGFESSFRSVCEITLKVLRSQADPLINVLSTFLHDPLVEWVKSAKRNTQSTTEQGNEMALKMLGDVEKRLRGIAQQLQFGVSLSTEGHVHYLIQEATSVTNLAQMYFGWAAYH